VRHGAVPTLRALATLLVTLGTAVLVGMVLCLVRVVLAGVFPVPRALAAWSPSLGSPLSATMLVGASPSA
jgi:hypothetical protein